MKPKRVLSLAATAVMLLTLLPAGAVTSVSADMANPVETTAGNPFITSIYTADPSARVWQDGRLYVYPSHDMEPPNNTNTGCDKMDNYHVYSTDNMVDWRDEGQIWSSAQVEWDQTPAGTNLDPQKSGLPAAFMWAPDCMYYEGKYYFYYPRPINLADWNNTWAIGVLVSDFPDKDFTSIGYITVPGGGPWTGNSFIDPNIFEDDDGTMYIYAGGGNRAYYGILNPDMKSLRDDPVLINGNKGGEPTPLTYFHEGSWVFKRNGIYYYTYPGRGADNGTNNDEMLYATGPSATGPWTYQGAILGITNCDTSHGSVVEFKGKWYVFYHNATLSGGKTNLRSICVDELNFNDDGSIQRATQTTTGPAANGPIDPPDPNAVTYEAENASPVGAASVITDANASGGKAVQGVQTAGNGVTFNNVTGGDIGGRAELSFRYAAAAKNKLKLTVNGKDWSTINLPATGGVGVYTGMATFTVPVTVGETNTVTVTGAGGQAVTLDALVVTPFNDANEQPLPYVEKNRIWMTSSAARPASYQTFTVTTTVTGPVEEKESAFTVSDDQGLEILKTTYDAAAGTTTATVLALSPGNYVMNTATLDGGMSSVMYVTVGGSIDPPYGDINLDGKVDTTDARLVLQYIVGKYIFKDAQYMIADVSFDGKVDTTDARMILQKIVGKIDSFT